MHRGWHADNLPGASLNRRRHLCCCSTSQTSRSSSAFMARSSSSSTHLERVALGARGHRRARADPDGGVLNARRTAGGCARAGTGRRARQLCSGDNQAVPCLWLGLGSQLMAAGRPAAQPVGGGPRGARRLRRASKFNNTQKGLWGRAWGGCCVCVARPAASSHSLPGVGWSLAPRRGWEALNALAHGWRRVGVGWGLFLSGLAARRAAARGVVRLARKGAGVMRRRGAAEPATT